MQRILSLLHQQSLTTALRAVSAPVDRSHIDTRAFRRLCADLKASMRSEGGVGLAAPQCGETLRLFVMAVHPTHRRVMRSTLSKLSHTQQRVIVPLAQEAPLSEEEWDERLEEEEDEADSAEEDQWRGSDERGHPSTPMVLINPVILAASPHSGLRQEACLSIPGFVGSVLRPACVDVRYVDEWNVERQVRLRGFDARVCQHETDHLQGVLYIDHITQPDEHFQPLKQ